MSVGALLDLGVPLEHVQAELAKVQLPSDSYALSISRTERQHVAALKFDVAVHDHHTHRQYAGIDAMIAGSRLSETTKETARKIFRVLAEAEAKVHGVPLAEVHFHEVGAVDSIVDIVATAVCLEYLGVERIYVSALPLGSGFVETAHGTLPVPAPATAELLRGLKVHTRCGAGERVTPTGAAIVAALASGCGDMPDMMVEQIGSGAGSKEFPDGPNILRAFLGTGDGCSVDEVIEACCNLDDVSPEIVGYTAEILLERGALDVWLTPVQMKKGRPGVILSFLCVPAELEQLTGLLMAETGTLGVRYDLRRRTVLNRRVETRDTQFGPVRFKVGEYGEKPEFDDCRRIAREQGLPCRDVMKKLMHGELS
jgi:uncharacterized protein (TIGR00299 family) protein